MTIMQRSLEVNSMGNTNNKIINHEKISTVLLTAVLQLQVFRNLSLMGYIAVLLLSYIYWFTSIDLRTVKPMKFSGIVFFFCYIGLPMISLISCSAEDFKIAIIRFGAMMPFMIIGLLRFDIIYKYSYSLLKTYTIIVIVSAALMIYQVPFGKISFFVDTAGRMGYERYGSLLGSTTTYGASSLVAIMCLHDYKMFDRTKSIIFEILILIGGILCLSKAFFINVAMAYVLIIIFHSKEKKHHISINKLIYGFLILLIIIGVLYLLIENTFIGNYFYDMLNYTFNSNSLGTKADLSERLTTRPMQTFAYHNNSVLYYSLFGVGFKGYSGILGLSQYPMCHNNYFDIILSQGLPALLSLLAIYIGAFVSNRNDANSESRLVKQLVPYILINMLAGQWSYLTVGGMLFLIIIHSIYNRKVIYNDDAKNISMHSNMEKSF